MNMHYVITLIDGTVIELPVSSNSFIISQGEDYIRWWNSYRLDNAWLTHYWFLRETEDGKFFTDFVCYHNEVDYYKKASLYEEVVNVDG